MPAKKPLTELTADIVTAHVANNPVSPGDLPDLIGKVHEALSSALSSESVAGQPAGEAPADSVQRDHLICLACGRKHATLKRHLKAAHQLTPEQYPGEVGTSRPLSDDRARLLGTTEAPRPPGRSRLQAPTVMLMNARRGS